MNNSKEIFKLIVVFAIGLLVGAGTIFSINYRNDGTISIEETKEKTLNVINQHLLPSGMTASLIGAVTERGLHKITIDVQGQDEIIYVSKDGALLFPQAIHLEDLVATPPPASPESIKCEKFQAELTPERKVKIAQCLTERGYKIYYADWCPFCVQQKEMFGEAEKYLYGFDCYDPEGEQGNITKCPDLRGVPAWRDGVGNQLKYNGEVMHGMIQIRRLVEISGCDF